MWKMAQKPFFHSHSHPYACCYKASHFPNRNSTFCFHLRDFGAGPVRIQLWVTEEDISTFSFRVTSALLFMKDVGGCLWILFFEKIFSSLVRLSRQAFCVLPFHDEFLKRSVKARKPFHVNDIRQFVISVRAIPPVPLCSGEKFVCEKSKAVLKICFQILRTTFVKSCHIADCSFAADENGELIKCDSFFLCIICIFVTSSAVIKEKLLSKHEVGRLHRLLLSRHAKPPKLI